MRYGNRHGIHCLTNRLFATNAKAPETILGPVFMMYSDTRKVLLLLAVLARVSLFGFCADKPGSKGKCEDMSAKSEGV